MPLRVGKYRKAEIWYSTLQKLSTSILSKSPLPFNGKIRRNDGNEQSRDKENRNKKDGVGSEADKYGISGSRAD